VSARAPLRVNAAEQAEDRLLAKLESLGGERAVAALCELRQSNPRAYWPLYGFFRQLTSRLDRAEEAAMIYIVAEVCDRNGAGRDDDRA